MSTPLNTLLCNLPSFHQHYSNEKPFRASLSSVLILLGVQIRCMRSISALTQEILCRQGTKLSKLVYCPVKVSFLFRGSQWG